MKTVVKNIVTPVFPASVNILTYPLPVLLSGKMLAVLERTHPTPRDLYDLFWLLSRNVTEDMTYLNVMSQHRITNSRALYEALLANIEKYTDRQIMTELGALLPAKQRKWACSSLKARTRALLEQRLQSV